MLLREEGREEEEGLASHPGPSLFIPSCHVPAKQIGNQTRIASSFSVNRGIIVQQMYTTDTRRRIAQSY